MCTDEDLIKIAKKLPQWEPISCEFSNPIAGSIEIKNDNPSNYFAQKRDALFRWKSKNGPAATFGALVEVFRKDDNIELAEEVEKMALKGEIE